MTKDKMTSGAAMSRRLFLGATGAGIVAMSMPGTLRAQTASGDARLRFALSAAPPNLNPWVMAGLAAGTVKMAAMRGLACYDNEGNLVPELAEGWTQVDDTTLEVKIRDNAIFHNGEPVTAADVAWTVEQIVADSSTAYLKTDFQNVEEVEIVDDKTVRFHLKKPTATFVNTIADFNAPIVWRESSAEEPVTAGPFRITGQERGVSVSLEAFEGWWEEGKPGVAGVDFVVYSDENLRFAALQAGDVDIIEYVPWQSFETLAEDDTKQIQTSMGPFMFLQFNCTKPPFDNPLVRQAIGYAIERQDVVDAAFAGKGTPLTVFPNPPGSVIEFTRDVPGWSTDLEKAKAMLAEAGYPNGFSCRILSTSTYGMHQDTASIVQAYLQMIGIDAQLDLPEWGARVTAGTEGNYDLAVHGSAGFYNDPDSLYSMLYSNNPTYMVSHGFHSERINSLLDNGRAELDPEARNEIYTQLAEAYFEEVPQVPLNWREQAYGMAGNVSGFNNLPGFLTILSPDCLEDVTLG